MSNTYSFVAKPMDSRCRWWCKVLSHEQLHEIDLRMIEGASDIPGRYLRSGDDLELDPGDVVVHGEARHHRKMRGWGYQIGVVKPDASGIAWRTVEVANDKREMKAADFQVVGSGPVAGALRLAQFVTRP